MPRSEASRYTPISTQKHASKQTATEISRSRWVLWLVAFYSTLVLFSWTVVCLLNYRPVTAASYQKYPNNRSPNPQAPSWIGPISSQPMRAKYDSNERWYKAVQVIQSIVGLLTIPITSAVCSSAVVVYLQWCKSSSKPTITLRQFMVLADKGWTDLSIYPQISTKWARYGTPFLAWALALHLAGAVIAPIQQIFLSTEVVKTPTNITVISQLLDVPNKFDKYGELTRRSTQPKLSVIPMTQKLLESTSAKDIPSQLWTTGIDCTRTGSDLCFQVGSTWADISVLPETFWAQLPNNYSTGLIRQYLPRFNSSTQYDYISSQDFPRGCDAKNGALSLKHSHTLSAPSEDGNKTLNFWGLHACMPGNQLPEPWKNTRDRQDFGEVLYLNITKLKPSDGPIAAANPKFTSVYVRVIVNTTAGYFELPNYMNGQTAGPLLERFPYDTCDSYCDNQGVTTSGKIPKQKRERQDFIPTQANKIEEVINKGPLLTTTLALFGRYSWLETANRFDTLYGFRNRSDDVKSIAGLVPMGKIIRGLQASARDNNEAYDHNGAEINDGALAQTHPLYPDQKGYYESDMFFQITQWLNNFQPWSPDPSTKLTSDQIMADAFNIAVYLANIAWITDTKQIRGEPTLAVSYDQGADSKKPSISLAGIILVSILITFHLVGLFITALYASCLPRWTNALNSFSLLRLGGSISKHLPLEISRNDDRIEALDALPGWIGHGTYDSQSKALANVELGGSGPLRTDEMYKAYDQPAVRSRKPGNVFNRKLRRVQSWFNRKPLS
ncbi:hypothetical protein N7492_005217 [Penicillium capsulatum]|uniref:Uncharacterized protein n=1 Tax=Penicillium capsulatum TaxID=69766 RepID=A0A9W9IB87_9EURO|nr:hypothetical protein N7492_005217 [Penicillium capsulatum]